MWESFKTSAGVTQKQPRGQGVWWIQLSGVGYIRINKYKADGDSERGFLCDLITRGSDIPPTVPASSPTLSVSFMDAKPYPGRGFSLSQLVFALNEELKRTAYSPSCVTPPWPCPRVH